jgi:hypothetical protein
MIHQAVVVKRSGCDTHLPDLHVTPSDLVQMGGEA